MLKAFKNYLNSDNNESINTLARKNAFLMTDKFLLAALYKRKLLKLLIIIGMTEISFKIPN